MTAVIVLLLAVTGILLNHSHRLGLDRSHVQTDWLLAWYGLAAPPSLSSYRAGTSWVSWTGSRLYVDDKPVTQAETPPVGSAAVGDGLLIVAFADSLMLVSSSGQVVERVGRESLPGSPQAVALLEPGTFVIRTPQGAFASDLDMTAWRPAAAHQAWTQPEEAPPALRGKLVAAEPGTRLSVERVLQDLHSGRIFGRWGPWLMDAAALAFIVLAITGIGYWWSRRAVFTPANGRRRKDD